MQLQDNILYFINSSHQVVYFNDNAKKAFPHMEVGVHCKEATGTLEKACINCPMNSKSSGNLSKYSEQLGCWLNISMAPVTLPGYEDCYAVTGSYYSTAEKNVMSRMKYMRNFDFVLEMNFTQDNYMFLSADNHNKKNFYSEESISNLLNRTASTIVHPDDRDKFMEFFSLTNIYGNLFKSETPLGLDIRERNSRDSWDQVHITLIPETDIIGGDKLVMALISMNDTETTKLRNDSELELDSLTSLYNKTTFLKKAEEYIQDVHNELCVIYMDIEHFRFFNKWYSRWQGDRLLKSFALFLHGMDRMFSSVSGYAGGDDFFIIVEKVDQVLEYMVSGLNKLVSNFDGIEGFKIAYGGYVLKPGDEIMDALDNANTASKGESGSSIGEIRWYGEEMNELVEEEMKILPDFDRAITEREFEVFFQPKCSIKTGNVIGSEALVRWNHKIRGYISPGEFIPIFERNGLITKLDVYVWEEVCRNLKAWIDMGIKPAPVSINLSRVDIFSMNVPEILSGLLAKYKLDHDLLEVEITESAFVDDMKLLKDVISVLHDKGFKILIDDFGSGYSSLNMLKDVQADILKMDIKFFDLNETNFEKGLSIISSVIEMSHSINLPVIAEGVETQPQIDMLKKLGLDCVQGFFFYRPMPAKEFENLLEPAS